MLFAGVRLWGILDAMSVINLVRRFTVDQWSAIDAEYLKPGAKTTAKGICSLVLTAVLLILKRYFGRPSNFRTVFGSMVENWPFPDIWAYFYGRFSSLIVYFVIPYLLVRFVFHERLRDHGFRIKGIHRYIWIYLVMLLVVLPLVIVASLSSDFTSKYPLYPKAGNSLAELLIWESVYGLYFVALEFFFRGFMLFTMARYLGAYAIFVMVIPYAMVHFGKPFAETIGSIVAGTALGTLALRTRSIFGGVFIHIVVALSMDMLAILAAIQNRA
jgi:hypothetical protein